MADGSLEPAALNRLMTAMRPRLHRYCARMIGSAIDGEDVVQDALAKAAEALPGAGVIAEPEHWLFRIAHNAALDALRKRKRRAALFSEADPERLADAGTVADARVGAAASLAALLRLPVAQRATVALADILGHSLAETADILGVTPAAAKAALHRGRARLKADHGIEDAKPARMSDEERRRLFDYADRFNARDFDALRALLAEEVRLDLVYRVSLAGRRNVSVYFTRYSESQDWFFFPGLAEGRPALLARDPADASGALSFIVFLDWIDGQIVQIRDFHYARYVVESLDYSPL